MRMRRHVEKGGACPAEGGVKSIATDFYVVCIHFTE